MKFLPMEAYMPQVRLRRPLTADPAPPETAYEVFGKLDLPCNCFYESRDPDSYHLSGCNSLHVIIVDRNGEHKTVRRDDVELVAA